MPDLLEATDLLPARMLNEFTYCPRLAYLEWVQGEWADNADTLDGEYVHRNADRPDHRAIGMPGPDEVAEEDRLHARSLRLESEELGVVAVVDIVEVEGQRATPVDYKKGAAPDIPEGAWEPERVQLCAQGLLLREAGFECDEGFLWYAGSRRRVSVRFDDALVARTRELIAGCRQMARGGAMPLPLVDSPKCPRCSLVGICLPDETHLLLQQADANASSADDPEPPTRPRTLLAPRPETIPLHIAEPGARVGKRGDRLVVELKDETLAEVRLKDVSELCLYGPVQVSTQAMHELLDRDIAVCYFTSGGWFRGIAHGMAHKNIELRIRQHAVAADPNQALCLARAFVAGKIRGGRTLLRRNLPEGGDILDSLAQAARDAERSESIGSLMGVEGMAAKRYFAAFATLFKDQRGIAFEGRNRRPPTDPVNATLSFLYSLLARELTAATLACGLDPYLGFLHQPRYGRPALALDLAEEFRSLLADSTALSLFNTGELTANDFVARAGAVALRPTGRKAVLKAWERRLLSEVIHPVFGYTASYRRILMIQARLLGRVLLGELPEYPAFKTR
jgi:CRISPR-associated protein Cas1